MVLESDLKKNVYKNITIFVETTGFHGAGHAIETMGAISQDPSLPVKIYLDEIDKLGNYESILTKWRLYIFPRDVIVTSNHL